MHEKSINHLSSIEAVYQERLEHQQLHKGQIEMVYQQELDHERNQEAHQNAIYQQEQRELEQEREQLQKIRHLFQAFLDEALIGEYSKDVEEEYQQDNERHQQQGAITNPGLYDDDALVGNSNQDLLFSSPPLPSGHQGSPPTPSLPPLTPSLSENQGTPSSLPSSQIHSLGSMDVPCTHCHALHFMAERLSNSSLHNPHFGLCFLQGQVDLPYIQHWPCMLENLFSDPQDCSEF